MGCRAASLPFPWPLGALHSSILPLALVLPSKSEAEVEPLLFEENDALLQPRRPFQSKNLHESSEAARPATYWFAMALIFDCVDEKDHARQLAASCATASKTKEGSQQQQQRRTSRTAPRGSTSSVIPTRTRANHQHISVDCKPQPVFEQILP